MAVFEDRYWQSPDGLKLHYRAYPGRPDRPPVLCLPGLTRNARDFATLAERLSPEWRVLALDFRGRGGSAPARDAASYVPPTYVGDVIALLDQAGIARFVAIGTSLGGLVTMLTAAREPSRIAGAVLNDIGPEIDAAGLARIRGYVGKANSWPTWMHAARALAEANGDIHPGYAIADWLAMAKRVYRVNSAGRIVLDYDLRIAEPFRAPPADGPAPDLWPALKALDGVPVAIVRGARSDILSAGVAARMAAALPRAELVTLAEVGHAPTLDEPEAAAAIERMLARVAAEPTGG